MCVRTSLWCLVPGTYVCMLCQYHSPVYPYNGPISLKCVVLDIRCDRIIGLFTPTTLSTASTNHHSLQYMYITTTTPPLPWGEDEDKEGETFLFRFVCHFIMLFLCVGRTGGREGRVHFLGLLAVLQLID